ncbi:MAG: molecular chaperone HtpG [Bacteroidetes bacterium]|nr:molecular chaperone HtpG [Bacteroidota bacterium]
MKTGSIHVQTENIFPIIKKFLYSNNEIFLRELVSNGVDAIQKLKTIASSGELKDDLDELMVEVKVDKAAKTITVSDNGIGMTADEVEKYIGQIAFSSAEEFVNKYKDKTEAIIGHFGLGFYSAYMVAEKVEVITKTWKKGPGSKAIKWSCDGSPSYQIEDADRKQRGTDIILHIADDSVEFLEETRISEILNKYARFMPVLIKMGEEDVYDEEGKKTGEKKARIINNPSPAWTKKPVDLKDEDYLSFYRELYPLTYEDPLFWIHINVDYPFKLTGILYFPKIKDTLEVQRNKIQLYCNQVFVTDSVENIVPDFLTLLHGVLDSPDIPLNVSRSYLQTDSNVKKISSHIMKKVADKLEEMFKNDREEFEKKWDDLKIFIQYGMITEEKFYERAEKFALYKNEAAKYFTFDDYEKHIEILQKDKDNKLTHLYATNLEEQYTYIEAAKNRNYDVLVMDGRLDNHFINHLESKRKDVRFARVDSNTVDKLIEKDEKIPVLLTEEDQQDLRPVFSAGIDKNYAVVFEPMSETDNPVVITRPEFMRRMNDMQKISGGGSFAGFPEMMNLVVNANHPLVKKIADEKNSEAGSDLKPLKQEISSLEGKLNDMQKDEEARKANKDEIGKTREEIESLKGKKDEILKGFAKKHEEISQMTDLALLSQNLLTGESLSSFIKRSFKMLGEE